MNYTEDQFKAALVAALPERLWMDIELGKYQVPRWVESRVAVTPHEWPAIVGMVEDGLTLDQRQSYSDAIYRLCDRMHRMCPVPYLALTAKWPVRAQALADIGAIKVEEAK